MVDRDDSTPDQNGVVRSIETSDDPVANQDQPAPWPQGEVLSLLKKMHLPLKLGRITNTHTHHYRVFDVCITMGLLLVDLQRQEAAASYTTMFFSFFFLWGGYCLVFKYTGAAIKIGT